MPAPRTPTVVPLGEMSPFTVLSPTERTKHRAKRRPTNPSTEWMLDGACNEYDPLLWQPERESEDWVADARTVCVSCPVRARCLEFALSTNQPSGVWGGLTTRERRREAQRRRGGAV